MTVRAVEWKKPYTWGKAIEITEDKVINLRLRDENNLIIWDEGDNEIYVDLQLWDEITPTDTFPVWITTGRAIVDNWWDATGTLVCFKTTSGDNIKLFYTDSGSVFVDNGTWTFKQIYLKSEVDALLATKQNLLTAWDNITIDSNNVISSDKGIVVSNTQPSDATEWLLWYNTVTDQLKVYDWTDWNWIWWGGGGSTYTAWHWINIDSNDEISNTLPFEPTNTWTAGQVLKLDSHWDYWWDNESWGGSDIEYVTSAEYTALLPWAESDGKHYFIYTESGWGWWQPWANTIAWYPLNSTYTDTDQSWNWNDWTTTWTITYNTLSAKFSSGNYIDIPTIIPYWSNPYTISVWYNTADSSWHQNVVYCQVGQGVNNTASALFVYQWHLYYWASWVDWDITSATISNNTWYNIVITYNGTSLWCYLNNTSKGTTNRTISSAAPDFASIWRSPSEPCIWNISNLIIEDRVRTAQEISDYYDLTKWDYWIS